MITKKKISLAIKLAVIVILIFVLLKLYYEENKSKTIQPGLYKYNTNLDDNEKLNRIASIGPTSKKDKFCYFLDAPLGKRQPGTLEIINNKIKYVSKDKTKIIYGKILNNNTFTLEQTKYTLQNQKINLGNINIQNLIKKKKEDNCEGFWENDQINIQSINNNGLTFSALQNNTFNIDTNNFRGIPSTNQEYKIIYAYHDGFFYFMGIPSEQKRKEGRPTVLSVSKILEDCTICNSFYEKK